MYYYVDVLFPGGRRPNLYFVNGDEVVKFAGTSISGFCKIATVLYGGRGTWSNTTYQLDLCPGVCPLYLLSPPHGTWGDDLNSWGEVAEKLGLSVNVTKMIIRNEYEVTAERLDEPEDFTPTAEIVVISFGLLDNWEKPESSETSDGRTVTVVPGSMLPDEADRRAWEWGEKHGYAADSPAVSRFRNDLMTRASWDWPTAVEPEGAKVISSRRLPGMLDSYWAIKVAVPPAPS